MSNFKEMCLSGFMTKFKFPTAIVRDLGDSRYLYESCQFKGYLITFVTKLILHCISTTFMEGLYFYVSG
jgi:hypothetical protein